MIDYKTKRNYFDTQSSFIDKMRLLNEDYFYKTGKQKRAFTHSYGCQQNLSDTEKINGQLFEMGFAFTTKIEEADFILYNTCAVRENAENRVFGNVGALIHYKKENPDLIIGLAGCMMQQKQVIAKIQKSYPFVDLIFGTHAIHELPEMVFELYTKKKRVVNVIDDNETVSEGLPIKRDKKHKAWVSIMYGCNNYCTYCIVPYVRGKERSRKSEDILKEIKDLIAEGYREFVLLGQNVNSYGKNIDGEHDFSSLLEAINSLDGDFRIRFMTSNPKDLNKKLIDTISRCKKVERHIHLPVQSGSDDILEKMNRGYTASKYLDSVNYAKEIIPEITLSTDIIVGFPGETIDDFEMTMELIRKVNYTHVYNFIYSKRQGTTAANYEDITSAKEKTQWLMALIEEQKIIGREVLKEKIGKIVRVFVENSKEEGLLSGKDDSYTQCEFKGDKNLIGTLVNVKIESVANWAAYGEIVK